MKNLRLFFLLIISVMVVSLASADNYIVIGKDGKVFDEPNSKYITQNQEDQDVLVQTGMVFKVIEKNPGWTMIEYSPGLRAYISEQIITDDLLEPKDGTYSVKNKPSEKVTITHTGNNWTLSENERNFNGMGYGNIVVFTDSSGNTAFSLINLGNGGIVMDYDNSVTHFF